MEWFDTHVSSTQMPRFRSDQKFSSAVSVHPSVERSLSACD